MKTSVKTVAVVVSAALILISPGFGRRKAAASENWAPLDQVQAVQSSAKKSMQAASARQAALKKIDDLGNTACGAMQESWRCGHRLDEILPATHACHFDRSACLTAKDNFVMNYPVPTDEKPFLIYELGFLDNVCSALDSDGGIVTDRINCLATGLPAAGVDVSGVIKQYNDWQYATSHDADDGKAAALQKVLRDQKEKLIYGDGAETR